MDSFKQFLKDYAGAIIGALIAILILITRLYELIISVSESGGVRLYII